MVEWIYLSLRTLNKADFITPDHPEAMNKNLL